MTLRNKILIICATLCLFACSEAEQQQEVTPVSEQALKEQQQADAVSIGDSDTHERVLANGLKVIVKEDHRSPVVASMIWYKVGSSHEPEGLTGIAHVFEHMMFKGTENYAPNEFSRIIAENGGTENAFTGRDYTAYFQQLEKSRLSLSFEMEADRMRNLKMIEEEFIKEMEVVKEERRLRTDDKPRAYTYEAFNKAAHDVSNYRNPIIGWPEDLENMPFAELEPWYRRYYAPNNATVVVAGDVQPAEVFALAEKYFGPLSAEELPQTKILLEPAHEKQRRIIVKRKARVPYLLMGFQAPEIRGRPKNWKPYALQVLVGILDGGKSARFERNLIRKQKIAASTWVDYDPFVRLDAMVLMGLTPVDGVTTQQLEQAIWQQINDLKTTLVDEKELQRVKAQMAANDVFQRDSVFYQAMKIGKLETIGLSWELGDQWLERIQAVTPEQVQAVANSYLIEQVSTVATLKPLSPDSKEEPSVEVVAVKEVEKETVKEVKNQEIN